MPAVHSAWTGPELADPDLLRRINALRRPDNVTNWFYLAREYVFLSAVAALTIAFYFCRGGWGLTWAWDLPVTFVAVVLMGVGQHRLITLGHEASHYLLFRNRLLNELASDWFCLFPLGGITHNYRVQHLAHHQHVNDPERDPDLAFMKRSGHEHHFPMSKGRFLWNCLLKTFLWVPGLVQYVLLRARHATLGALADAHPSQGKRPRLVVRVAIGYLAILVAALTTLCGTDNPWLLALVPGFLWAALLVFFLLAPARMFSQVAVKPVVTPRWWSILRITYLTVLFTVLAWLSDLTGKPWGLYYLVLWVVPLLTTFAFLMILREIVQHGDAGRERFTHSRNFRGNPLVRFAVFPLGMDYHLPHHLFPMVPHYRLKALHALLRQVDVYNRQAPMVAGDFYPLVSRRVRSAEPLTTAPSLPTLSHVVTPHVQASPGKALVQLTPRRSAVSEDSPSRTSS